jgi:RNA polymerase primary sigma factor
MRKNSLLTKNPDHGGWSGTLVCDDIEDAAGAHLEEAAEENCFPGSADLLDLAEGFLPIEEESESESEDIQDSDATEDLVRTYFHSMGDIAVLTKDEETELAKKVEEGMATILGIMRTLPAHRNIVAEMDKSAGDQSDSNVLEANLKVLEEIMKKIEAADDKTLSNGYRPNVRGEDMGRAASPAARTEYRRTGSELSADMTELKRKWEQIKDARRSIALAKDELIIRNLRLVITVAKHYVGRGLPLLDLIQEGNIGLMKAVDRFKYEMGFKFSTYATWWIRQAITRSIMEQAKTIRVPVHIVEFYNRVAKAARELTQELGREPGNREIAKKLRVPVKKVDEVCKAIRTPVALETPVGTEDSVLGDFIGDRETPLPDASFERKEVSKHMLKLLKTLSHREERVIRMRYGIGVDRDHTLEEIGRKLSITRERVRQIEVQAMRKLRHPSRMRTLQELTAL